MEKENNFINDHEHIKISIPKNGDIELHFYQYPKCIISLEDATLLKELLSVAIQETLRRQTK